MVLRIIEHDRLDACSQRQWSELIDASSEATVFQRREWIQSWWDAFAEPGWRIRLFLGYRDDELILIAPLYVRPAAARPGCSVHFLGEEHADYITFIARDSDPAAVAATLRCVVESTERGDRICLDEAPVASTLQKVLAGLCRSQPLQWVETGRTPCPWIAVRDDEAQARSLLRKQSLRRHRAALSRLGTLEIRHECDAAVIAPHLTRFFDQHVARWRGSAYPSLFEKGSNRDFYRRFVAALCPERQVLFSILSLDQTPIAYHLGFLSNSTLLWYKPTFDVGLARCSPGEVLLGALLEYALDNRLVAIDFTRGDERFKSRFASRLAMNASYARLGSRTQAVEHHARRCARAVLNRLGALAAWRPSRR